MSEEDDELDEDYDDDFDEGWEEDFDDDDSEWIRDPEPKSQGSQDSISWLREKELCQFIEHSYTRLKLAQFVAFLHNKYQELSWGLGKGNSEASWGSDA